MEAVAFSDADVRDVKTPKGQGSVRTYFGEILKVHEGPQGFLVDWTNPGARIDPHFHDVDQFQVVVRGTGRIGKKAIAPITFHYADAFTPYGPIVAEGEGIGFFTLRVAPSSGIWPMPGSRRFMPGRAGRNIAGLFRVDAGLPEAGGVRRESLIPATTDGMMAEGLTLGSGATARGPGSNGGGQYAVLCRGSIVEHGKVLGENALLWVRPGEKPPVFSAGPAGARILVLEFPRPSERPGSDPLRLAARAVDAYSMPQGFVKPD
jgi:hypothetical protein